MYYIYIYKYISRIDTNAVGHGFKYLPLKLVLDSI